MTAATDYHDALIRHLIQVGRFTRTLETELLRLLDAGDVRAMTRLLTRGERGVDELKESSRENAAAVVALLLERLREFAKMEGRFQRGLLEERIEEDENQPIVPIPLPTGVLAAAGTAVVTHGFSNTSPKTLNQLIGNWRRQAAITLPNGVQQGLTAGAPLERVIRDVRGRQIRRRLVGGRREPDRRNLRTIVTTAVDEIVGSALAALGRAVDIIDREVWVSLLDTRVCPYCRGQHGRVYEVDVGPRPRAHPRCRCTRAALLVDETARDLLGEDNLTYDRWLRRQSAAVQDDVLGRARGRLYRRGDFTVGDFFDYRAGQTVTLEELYMRSTARSPGLFRRIFPESERGVLRSAGVPI